MNVHWAGISLILVLMPGVEAAEEGPKRATLKAPAWFSKLDSNRDEVLDGDEAPRLVKTLDENSDGSVSIVEAVAWEKKRRETATRKGGRGRRQQMLRRAEELSEQKKTGKGLWVVSIGHSCVIPAIEPCIKISRSAGFENHAHFMQFAGGAGGAAKAQWNRPDEKQEAKPALVTGKIDVMTFGHLVAFDGKSYGCDVADYERWIGFALKHNPQIRFYIQDLWPWLPGPPRGVKIANFKLEAYEAAMATSSQSVAAVVAQLNREHPGRVKVLPVGVAMTELVRRAQSNDLPGVDAILVSPKDKEGRVGLYRDKIHPTNVVAAIEGYVYYACLYGKNPVNLDEGIYPDEKLDAILREVAWKTVTEHSLSGLRK